MCVLSDDCKDTALIRVGMVLLAIAEVARFVLQRQHFSSDLADGLTGLVFGVAIGTLLLGVYLRAHPRRAALD